MSKTIQKGNRIFPIPSSAHPKTHTPIINIINTYAAGLPIDSARATCVKSEEDVV